MFYFDNFGLKHLNKDLDTRACGTIGEPFVLFSKNGKLNHNLLFYRAQAGKRCHGVIVHAYSAWLMEFSNSFFHLFPLSLCSDWCGCQQRCCFDGGPAPLWARPSCSVGGAPAHRINLSTLLVLLPELWWRCYCSHKPVLFTESAQLKVYYLLDATVIIEMLLYSNVSVAVLYVSYILADFWHK